MPKYLARDYLNEYLQHSAEYLRLMLLTTPTEFEYPLNSKDNPFDVVTGATTLSKEFFTEDNHNFSGCNSFIFHVESYVNCPEHQNIVQIDSDLDCEINSSYGSSFGGGSDVSSITNEVLKSILVPSLCSKELNLSKLFLEEIEDGLENHSSTSLLSLIACLRPVKILDPFASCYFTGLSNLVLEFVPISESLSEISESLDRVSEKEILKFEKHLYSENRDLFLLENDSIENMYQDPLFDLKNYLDGFLNVTTAVSEDTLKWFNLDSFAHNIELFDGDIDLVADNMQPKKIQTSNDQQLESPFSDVESIHCDFMELPDMNLHAENITNDVLTILTPNSKLKAEKSLRDADKRYDERSLLLLPVLEEPVFQSEIFSLLTAKYLKESQLNIDMDNTLDWDPMFYFGKEIKLAEASLITTLNREAPSNISSFTFNKDVIPKNDKDEVINWPFAGKKLSLLQHLTSFKGVKYTNDVKQNVPKEDNNAMIIVNKDDVLMDFDTKDDVVDFVRKEENKPCFTNYLKIKKPETIKNKLKMMCNSPKIYQSPLDSFMMLRTGRFDPLPLTKNVKAFVKPVVCTVSAVKVRPMSHEYSGSFNQRSSLDHTALHNVSNCEDKRGSKSNQFKGNGKFDISSPKKLLHHQSSSASLNTNVVLDVCLSTEYISILNILERDSWSVLLDLKNMHLVGKSIHFLNITPDFSRFLLKQEEQKVEKELNIFSSVCILHGLVQAANLVANCSVEVACGFLKVFGQEKKAVLMNSLDHIQLKLAKFHFQSKEANTFHPKFISIYKLVADWLKNDLHSKIIILFHRHYDSLSHCLKAFLGTDKALNVNLYPQKDISEEDYISTFSNANVVLAAESEDMLTCPWQYFQFVIQFEHRLESHWHDLIFESNPELQQFVSLNVLINTSQDSLSSDIAQINKYINHSNIDKDKLCIPADPILTYIQHYILCSKNAVRNNELLVALENKENLIVVVKDYSKLKSITDFSFHPDILIDERTGVLTLDANDPACITQVDIKILSMALKCSVSHVVLTSYSNNVLDSTNICSQMIVLIANVIQLFKVSIKLHYVFSVQQLASLVRLLCDNAKKASTVWNGEQWVSRQWLKEDFSKQEEFLLTYPFINSFCAQIILKVVDSLSILMNYSLDELKVLLKCIPQHIIEAFYYASHNVDEFFHQPEYSVQKHLSPNYNFGSMIEYSTNEVKSKLLDNDKILFDTQFNNETSKIDIRRDSKSQNEMTQGNTMQTRRNIKATLVHSPDYQSNYQLPHEINYLQLEINKLPYKINHLHELPYKTNHLPPEIKHLQYKENEQLPKNSYQPHGINYLPHKINDFQQDINYLQHKMNLEHDTKHMLQEINYHPHETYSVKSYECLKEKPSTHIARKNLVPKCSYSESSDTNVFQAKDLNDCRGFSSYWNTSEVPINANYKSGGDDQTAVPQIRQIKARQKELNSESNIKFPYEKFSNISNHSSQFFPFDLTPPQSDSNHKTNSQMRSRDLSFLSLNSSLCDSYNQSIVEKQNSKETFSTTKNVNSCKPLWGQQLKNQSNDARNIPRQAVKAIQKQPSQAAIQVHGSQITDDVSFYTPSRLTSKDHINRKHIASHLFNMVPKENSSCFDTPDEKFLYLKSKKRKLSYERVPGATNGQTRLAFL